MAEYLHPPVPRLDGPYQPGVTDPVWPAQAPAGFDAASYAERYAGRVEPQRHLAIILADAAVASRAELEDIMAELTRFARGQMKRLPPSKNRRPFDRPPGNQRVTVTVGFGATLFTTVNGDDRFGVAGRRPASLKIIPKIVGDEGFQPRDQATDLVIMIASDHMYINEYLVSLLLYGKIHKEIAVRRLERGYARPDSKEPSGFEDGISNPRDLSPDSQMWNRVYVAAGDEEPSWCVNGTYLAYRKIRRYLAPFFALKEAGREAVFGVDDTSGQRLSKAASDAHAQKMNPRRPNHFDLFGKADDERRFFRRPYFYDDGLDPDGLERRGVHHLSFARDLVEQYEWPVQMWQTNPDFPFPGAGNDALYGLGGAANVSGGYYFIPPAPIAENEHLGTRLLS